MTHDDRLVPPSRMERILTDPVLVAVVYTLCLGLAGAGYLFDLDVLTGLASWVGGCAFVLGVQTIASHRRQRYQPQHLDSLREYVPPPLP